mmetsp:Transcript_52306/g.147250  ORF Transcript_52306/g.147250 Transcript_52306/m.147250 type:complete len:308 (-) Transcript_52306:224-1147(-)
MDDPGVLPRQPRGHAVRVRHRGGGAARDVSDPARPGVPPRQGHRAQGPEAAEHPGRPRAAPQGRPLRLRHVALRPRLRGRQRGPAAAQAAALPGRRLHGADRDLLLEGAGDVGLRGHEQDAGARLQVHRRLRGGADLGGAPRRDSPHRRVLRGPPGLPAAGGPEEGRPALGRRPGGPGLHRRDAPARPGRAVGEDGGAPGEVGGLGPGGAGGGAEAQVGGRAAGRSHDHRRVDQSRPAGLAAGAVLGLGVRRARGHQAGDALCLPRAPGRPVLALAPALRRAARAAAGGGGRRRHAAGARPGPARHR